MLIIGTVRERTFFGPKSLHAPKIHVCFHIFYTFTSSLSQCNINSAEVGSSNVMCFMQHEVGSSPCHFALLWPSCTCTGTGTGWWWRWWPRTPLLRWWRTYLKNKSYPVNVERELESHLSVGRTEGLTPNYTILLLRNLKFLSSTLSTTTHFG